jgi:hypothetical protein
MSTNTSRWWGDATADEASKCESVVNTFLNGPNPTDRDNCARAFALFILLGGDDTSILKRIHGVKDSQLNDVWIGLKLCVDKLSAFGAAAPDGLQASIAQLGERSQKRSDDNVAEKQKILKKLAESRPRLGPRPKG